MNTPRPPGRPDGHATPSDIHTPSGPLTLPPFDLRERQMSDEQLAYGIFAAGATDASGLLDLTAPFPHTSTIVAETKHRQAESLAARNVTDAFGRRLTLDVNAGRVLREAPVEESSAAATLRSSSLPSVTRRHRRAALKGASLRAKLKLYGDILAGKTTDASGTLLAAPIPEMRLSRYRLIKFLKKGSFAVFEALMLYFTLRLVVRTHPGPLQLLEETVETLGLVGLALFIITVGPTLLADQVASLRRHKDAIEAKGRKLARWLTISGILAVEGGLIVLTGILRAIYGYAGIGPDSALQVDFFWFLLFALVGLGGAFFFTFQIILKNDYQNRYIEKYMEAREMLERTEVEVDESATEITLRVDEIEFQEELHRHALDEHDVHRTVSLPAAARMRVREFFSTLATQFGNPHTTDAIVAHQEIVDGHSSLKFSDPLEGVLSERAATEAELAKKEHPAIGEVEPMLEVPTGAVRRMRDDVEPEIRETA